MTAGREIDDLDDDDDDDDTYLSEEDRRALDDLHAACVGGAARGLQPFGFVDDTPTYADGVRASRQFFAEARTSARRRAALDELDAAKADADAHRWGGFARHFARAMWKLWKATP